MEKKLYILLTAVLLAFSGWNKARAQIDPTLAGMILVYTDKAEKSLKNQEKVMLLQTTGHIWTKEEVKATADLQREFNDYLDSFRSVISYAAEIYGFYHEVTAMCDNLGDFSRQLGESPGNALAVALSARRNKIYREVILGGVEIVNDIRNVCMGDSKMTERERMETVFGIRPKLKGMNRKIRRLAKAVKYTTFGDIWAEIDEGSQPMPDKKEIARAAMQRWKRNGHKEF